MKKYQGLTQFQLYDELINACNDGKLKQVKYLLTSPELTVHANIHANNDSGFQLACAEGNLEVIKYLLTSTELKDHSNIHADKDAGFRLACGQGQLEVVKYLLTSKDLKERVVSTTDNNSGINIACGKGQLDVVKYLLSSNELKEQGLPLATMEFNHEGWWWAIEGGHLDVIQYLMTSPDLKKHIDIHKDQDKAFRLACERNQLEIIQYFIFEQLIPKTSDIKAYLKEQFNENQLGNKVVVNMFKVRDNYQKMQHSLEQKPAETKRFKI